MADKDNNSLIAFYDDYKAGRYGIHSTVYEQEGRLKAILNLLNFEDVNSLLDIGCGVGFMTRVYAGHTQGVVTGIDFSCASIWEASTIVQELSIANVKFEVMDAQELLFEDNTFDCVICSEVLEHLLNPIKALHEMNRVVKPDGKVIITMPNPWNWSIVLRRLLKRRPQQIHDKPINPLRFAKIVKGAGMHIVKRKWTCYLPPLISPQNVFHPFFARLSTFIENRDILPYVGLYQVYLLHKDRR